MRQTFIQEPNPPKRQEFIDAYLKELRPKNTRTASPAWAPHAYK